MCLATGGVLKNTAVIFKYVIINIIFKHANKYTAGHLMDTKVSFKSLNINSHCRNNTYLSASIQENFVKWCPFTNRLHFFLIQSIFFQILFFQSSWSYLLLIQLQYSNNQAQETWRLFLVFSKYKKLSFQIQKNVFRFKYLNE